MPEPLELTQDRAVWQNLWSSGLTYSHPARYDMVHIVVGLCERGDAGFCYLMYPFG